MPNRGPRGAETFGDALLALLAGTGLRMMDLAGRFRISTRTVTRYVYGRAVPPVGRRHGIVFSLRDLDPALVARVVASLGLTQEFPVGPPRPPLDLGVARQTAEAALLELVTRLDVGHGIGRQATLRFLGRLADANVDAATACELLTR